MRNPLPRFDSIDIPAQESEAEVRARLAEAMLAAFAATEAAAETSAAPPAAPAPATEPHVARSLDELASVAAPEVTWLWDGYLARGNVTLLTSQWKTGKTTLLGALLVQLLRGGKLGGRRVLPGRACIVSEERPEMWVRRCDKLQFDRGTLFHCRPFRGKPSLARWHDFLGYLADERARGAFDLLVIDTIAAMLPPGVENQPDALLAALRPLERIAQAGAAVLLMHHPRKGSTLPGQAARGTGALSAFCDILVELQGLPRAARDDRRRKLCGWSRYDETPGELVMTLAPDGRSYTATDDAVVDFDNERAVEVCREVLQRAGEMLTRDRVLNEWPLRPKPNPGTVWRWLDRGVAEKKLRREGNGRRGNPFRYGVAGDDAPWHPTDDDVLARIGGNYLDRLFK